VNHILMIVGIYIDDCLIIGKESTVSNLLDEMKKHEFNLKIKKDVLKYLSCCIVETKNEAKLIMIQLHLLTRLLDSENQRKYCSEVVKLLHLIK
jgi:hypothetical protein